MFCDLMHHAFLEVRNLTAVGFPEQANALADAFHNLPSSLFHPSFDWQRTRMYVGSYQKKYPRVLKDGVQYGSYYDYNSMLDAIEGLEKDKHFLK